MNVHRDYTWRLQCPACDYEIVLGIKKADHEQYGARFAVHEQGMFMTSQWICRECATRFELRKAMSTYGVMTMGVVDLRANEPKVDMRYPAEFSPPETAEEATA